MNYYPTLKTKLTNYLYEVSYKDIDYNFAVNYFKTHENTSFGGCTSFRWGNYFGRNYDWVYDNSCSFVVHTKHINYKVLGIAGNIKELTMNFVDDPNNDSNELYKILPFSLLDGINDRGLIMSMNVVPTDYGVNISEATIYQQWDLCSMMIPRFVLDNFANSIDAISYLQNYCRIYPPKKLTDLGYEIHFIISDSYNNTFVLEILNGKINVIRKNAITNFHLSNVKFNKDGKIFTPATQLNNVNAIITNNVTDHGCGLERYNIIQSYKYKCPNIYNMRNLLKDLMYSNTYKNLNWFTEFVGENYTVNTNVKEYIKKLYPILDELEYKDRETSKLWQTVHSSLYDIKKKTLELRVQENLNNVFRFEI